MGWVQGCIVINQFVHWEKNDGLFFTVTGYKNFLQWYGVGDWFLHMNLEKHLKFSLQFSEPEKDQLALENVVNKLCSFN